MRYFAVFYAIGIIIFGLFVRFWLRKKRWVNEEKKLEIKYRKHHINKVGTNNSFEEFPEEE